MTRGTSSEPTTPEMVTALNHMFLSSLGTRFLKKVLQFSENFNSLTSPAKNRWAEATTLCHTLFDLDTRHMTSHMTRHQTHD